MASEPQTTADDKSILFEDAYGRECREPSTCWECDGSGQSWGETCVSCGGLGKVCVQ